MGASKEDAVCAKTAILCAILCAGYMDIPASLPEDRSLLIDLFGLCLAGDAALHTRLVDALLDLSAVEAECRVVGTAASLGPEQPPLANVVAGAICGMKLQVCQKHIAAPCCCGFPPDRSQLYFCAACLAVIQCCKSHPR